MDLTQYHQYFGYVPVQVVALGESKIALIKAHFLQLKERDRYLRFGSYMQDAQVETYVNRLDFAHDAVFGVFDLALNLVGVGHLARMSADTPYPLLPVGKRARMAEFGISVLEQVRGLGVGSALFEHALTHCRNRSIYYLYMHCLSSNQGIMTIAKRAGMKIESEHGEADAYLALDPRNFSSLMTEALKVQTSHWDYAVKSQLQKSAALLARLTARQ